MSANGHISVDVSASTINFITSTWQPTDDYELAYLLTVDGLHKTRSEFRTVTSGEVASTSWQTLSDEFMNALETGKTLEVSVNDTDEEAVYGEKFSLASYSENLTALRKLVQDSPRSK